ncbi:hypothetical protein R3P38DRAFT_1707827 [Favolaschia claudopus]|uniref:Uncharacterized protein n=1 Tax=Favolaschia claudopus TaxID=2862362 RepID=A0AAW0ACK0_9AGAR
MRPLHLILSPFVFHPCPASPLLYYYYQVRYKVQIEPTILRAVLRLASTNSFKFIVDIPHYYSSYDLPTDEITVKTLCHSVPSNSYNKFYPSHPASACLAFLLLRVDPRPFLGSEASMSDALRYSEDPDIRTQCVSTCYVSSLGSSRQRRCFNLNSNFDFLISLFPNYLALLYTPFNSGSNDTIKSTHHPSIVYMPSRKTTASCDTYSISDFLAAPGSSIRFPSPTGLQPGDGVSPGM